MLTSIDVKFIFDSARLGLFSSTNIVQIASRCRPSSCLLTVFAMFLAIIRLLLPLKRVKCPPFLFSKPKQLSLVPRSSRLTVH